jgi:hypothetical protein
MTMNQVLVTGGRKTQREKVESIAHYVINKLMPRMRTLVVEIDIKDFEGDDSCGYCLPAGHADTSRPRDFEIEVNKDLTMRTLLETVAHELVHVKQYARKELFETSVGKHRWLNEWYDEGTTSYWDLPWEIEAHGRETGLFVRWAQNNGHTGKWTNSMR